MYSPQGVSGDLLKRSFITLMKEEDICFGRTKLSFSMGGGASIFCCCWVPEINGFVTIVLFGC